MWKTLLTICAPLLAHALFIQSVPGLFGKPSHFYPLPQTDDASVLLSIKGKHDARVWLCPDTYPNSNKNKQNKQKEIKEIKENKINDNKQNTEKENQLHPCFAGIEILFGYTSNQYITIRDHWYITETSTFISPLFHGNVLDENEYRPFWINWNNNEATVGFGHIVYKNVILAYREDALSSSSSWSMTLPHSYRLSRVAFSSWEEPIHFLFYLKRGIRHPYPTFSTSSEYEQFGQENTMLRLSTESFTVMFECQGLSECNLAFLRSYRWKTEDPQAIEIVLDDTFERRHLYSRTIIRYGTGLGGRILAEINRTVLSSSEFRPFWIKWVKIGTQGVLTIGKGITVGKNVLLQTITSFSTLYVYMGFSSYFLSTSVRILYALSDKTVLYPFDNMGYEMTKRIETIKTRRIVPLTFSHGTNHVNRGFRVSRVEQECPRLTQCQPPLPFLYPYRMKLPITPRIQWWHHGAYCAEVSIQTALLGKGVYMSQAWIRRHSPFSGNKAFFGDTTLGYEIVPGNMKPALRNLHVSYEEWKGNDATLFFKWIKKHIVKGNPIVWFIQGATSTYVEHAEIVSGYVSRYPLTHASVYPDDMIRYHNNIELLSYYRRVDSFVDKGDQKNCSNGSSFGTECVSPDYQVAVAILGMDRQFGTFGGVDIQVRVSDGGMESMNTTWITMTVLITNLKVNTRYKITRYTLLGKTSHVFTSKHTEFTWKDPHSIPSRLYVYYRVTASAPKFNIN
jgi:hypothetical protein